MKITLEMSIGAYPYAKQVYLNQLTSHLAWKILLVCSWTQISSDESCTHDEIYAAWWK